MNKRIALTISVTAFFAVALACSFGPATISDFKTSKDKDGKQDSSSFKSGETVYGNATVSGGSKSTVKFTLVADNAPGMKKGDVVQGSEAKVEMAAGGLAQFTMTVPATFSGGKFNVVADLMDEKGEKKETKSAAITIEGPPAPAAPPAGSDDKDHGSTDKDKDDH